MGRLMCLSGRVHQARGGLADAGRYILATGYQFVAAVAIGSTTCFRPDCAPRPGWPVRGQELQSAAA